MTHSTTQPPLTPEQAEAANHLTGALLLLAPVGSGKTRVLAERVVKAIEAGTAPHKILGLTFTNRAAREMHSRLLERLGPAARPVTIKTFHGLAAQMLRLEARRLGLPADFVIYDEADSLEIIKNLTGVRKDNDAFNFLNPIETCKIKASGHQLQPGGVPASVFAGLRGRVRTVAERYQAILTGRQALDFADLIYLSRATLQGPGIGPRWASRFDFVQVDEVQDTHLAEYEIVRHLAGTHGNLAFIGDLDQTIYEWRGSEPGQVLARFEQEFQPARLDLTVNHRATKLLLGAADAFAGSIEARQTRIRAAAHCPAGEKIEVHYGRDEAAEGQWIGRRIADLARQRADFAYFRTAILTRNHQRSRTVAAALSRYNIPLVTVEQYDFFRRQEIKDAVAWLRLILHPYDSGALQRLLLRPGRGIGPATIRQVQAAGDGGGLWLTDLVQAHTWPGGDPFGRLLTAYEQGVIVVFDVETTGLEVAEAEVIQLAAVRLEQGVETGRLVRYLKNSRSVGESEQVHGLSDDFLADHGEPAEAVLAAFFRFAAGALLVGHNVGFDVKMVQAHARRVRLTPPRFEWEDTYALARRFVEAGNYRLGTLVAELGLAASATHDAAEDVAATVELLRYLLPRVEAGAEARRKLVRAAGDKFKPLARQLAAWRQAAVERPPAELLRQVLIESGLWAYYENRGEMARLTNLETLVAWFARSDAAGLAPETALRAEVEQLALARNIDFVAANENRVVITTIHQAKGLEFDHVFLAGVVDEEFPTYFSCQAQEFTEERRLFYVALTRARQRLYISGYKRNRWGYGKPRSRFFQDIPAQYCETVR